MAKIIIDRESGRKDVFEIVDKIPEGYSIWQVPPMRGYENFLALCVCYPGTCDVQADKMKAIRVDNDRDRDFIKKFAMRSGCGNYAATEKHLRRRISEANREKALRALSIFARLTF